MKRPRQEEDELDSEHQTKKMKAESRKRKNETLFVSQSCKKRKLNDTYEKEEERQYRRDILVYL